MYKCSLLKLSGVSLVYMPTYRQLPLDAVLIDSKLPQCSAHTTM
jgi:hypothetical protein